MRRQRIKILPSQSVVDGRGKNGRFLPGNKLSQGNVAARKAAKIRNKLYQSISLRDFDAIVKRLLREAKSGQAWAVKLLFAYLLGEPISADILQQIESMENAISRLEGTSQ